MRLLAQIHAYDLYSFMPKFSANNQPGVVILASLIPTERIGRRSTGSRRLPASQFLITSLGIGMAKTVHLGQTRSERVALVNSKLLNVVSIAGN